MHRKLSSQFPNRKLLCAAIAALTLSTAVQSANASETYTFLFETGDASASGTLVTTSEFSTNNVRVDYASLTSLEVLVSGAGSGNGTFSLADFTGIVFSAVDGLDFSLNLYGQAEISDFNLLGGSPGPTGLSTYLLAADGATSTPMLLSCLKLSAAGSCFSIASVMTSLTDLQLSLKDASQGIDSNISTTNLAVNGAHSRPIFRLVSKGEKTFWVAGDIAQDNHGSKDGNGALAEVGFGYNYGPAQLNISLGKTWSEQNLTNNGGTDTYGKYVMVEGIIPIKGVENLYATIGTFGHWGSIDVNRGYLDGTNLEYSEGYTNSTSWGVRARLDWVSAFAAKSMQFSPYADIWYSDTSIDSYTESGGSLPASFAKRSDSVTDLRLGVNASNPIAKTNLNLVLNAEAVHRFGDNGAVINGQVAGLGSFSFAGNEYEQNWLKGGLGVEGKVGAGKISVMLNGTTEGEMPNTWIAATYQIAI
ncbi:autotransporter outer membrane beta-barrel domain-containing protein [Neptunomonas antarctica]|uniref:Autotransporter beta-domain-containing protein n=1 Tax=Neptunomonas antarctica TaxID=619304 RepID=A0A1N7LJ68_9GAMM|nr:autotransporter outer membrane beta-barrel domain-containing protein [Neptunomonas antarctica]SIS73853.1 Autotransporter beta-domain-containing protein [Neptunomonas antarctica]